MAATTTQSVRGLACWALKTTELEEITNNLQREWSRKARCRARKAIMTCLGLTSWKTRKSRSAPNPHGWVFCGDTWRPASLFTPHVSCVCFCSSPKVRPFPMRHLYAVYFVGHSRRLFASTHYPWSSSTSRVVWNVNLLLTTFPSPPPPPPHGGMDRGQQLTFPLPRLNPPHAGMGRGESWHFHFLAPFPHTQEWGEEKVDISISSPRSMMCQIK